MRAQSEAIGLAVIMALVIGGIVAYASFHKAPTPSGPSSNKLIAQNFAYVLLESDANISGCRERITNLVTDALSGATRYRLCGKQIIGPGTSMTLPQLANDSISNITKKTLDTWGLTYSLQVYDRNDPSQKLYDVECPGYGHGGVVHYPIGPNGEIAFTICS